MRFEIKHCNCWNELKETMVSMCWNELKRNDCVYGNRQKKNATERRHYLRKAVTVWQFGHHSAEVGKLFASAHDPWPTWLTQTQSYTQTQAYPCTDLAHKHIRPHKHIGPHRYIGQDQFTEFYSLLYIISFDGYLSICPFLNKRFEEKSPVSPTDICLLSWTTVSQRNPCWVGNSSGHLRP